MVSRLLRALSTGAESEFARADRRHQARSSRGQLEIALQQFTNNGAQLECARLFLQRFRLSHYLRMRLSETGYWIGKRKAPKTSGLVKLNDACHAVALAKGSILRRGKTELGPAALGVVLRFAAVLLI